MCSIEHVPNMTPQELQNLLDELEASRASRRRAWENLQEIRWVLKDTTGIELPPPARKTIDLEGRIVKDGVRKALRDRQLALTELVHAIREYRAVADSKPLSFQGLEYAHALQELNKAIDRAEGISRAGWWLLPPVAGKGFHPSRLWDPWIITNHVP
jgi:hypothetical protein